MIRLSNFVKRFCWCGSSKSDRAKLETVKRQLQMGADAADIVAFIDGRCSSCRGPLDSPGCCRGDDGSSFHTIAGGCMSNETRP